MVFVSASSIEAGKPYIVKTDADVSLVEMNNTTIMPMGETVSDNGVTTYTVVFEPDEDVHYHSIEMEVPVIVEEKTFIEMWKCLQFRGIL